MTNLLSLQMFFVSGCSDVALCHFEFLCLCWKTVLYQPVVVELCLFSSLVGDVSEHNLCIVCQCVSDVLIRLKLEALYTVVAQLGMKVEVEPLKTVVGLRWYGTVGDRWSVSQSSST